MRTKGFYAVVGITILIIAGAFLALRMAEIENDDQAISSQTRVTTSFYPLQFLAERIGGDNINVRNLTPPGIEPHEYEPTAQDIARLQESQLLILNGGGFEPWSESLAQNLQGKIKIIYVSEGLASIFSEEARDHEDEHGEILDPHLWLSPVLAAQQAEKIAAALIQINPELEDEYRSNLENLRIELAKLDQDYRQGLQGCSRNSIVTTHTAFAYLAEEYGLRQVPISGLSPEAEPSARDLARVASFARENSVEYIFFETLVDPKLARTIATEVGAETLVLNPIEGLTATEIASGKNYFTEMYANLDNLKLALGC